MRETAWRLGKPQGLPHFGVDPWLDESEPPQTGATAVRSNYAYLTQNLTDFTAK